MRLNARLLLPLALVLAAWSAIYFFQIFSSFLFPSPLDVLLQFFQFFTGQNLQDIGSTFYRIFISSTIGTAVGFLIGAAIYKIDWVYDSVSPLIDFYRSIPAAALVPLFLLFFGLGDTIGFALGIFTCASYFALHVSKGLRETSEDSITMAKALRKKETEIFWHIRIREALPMIFVGLRTAISLTVIVVIIAEMFAGAKYGIGRMLVDSANTFTIPKLYAGLILIGFIGYLLNLAIIRLEKRAVHWETSSATN